jgi:hypothetical protein
MLEVSGLTSQDYPALQQSENRKPSSLAHSQPRETQEPEALENLKHRITTCGHSNSNNTTRSALAALITSEAWNRTESNSIPITRSLLFNYSTVHRFWRITSANTEGLFKRPRMQHGTQQSSIMLSAKSLQVVIYSAMCFGVFDSMRSKLCLGLL